MSSYNTSPNFDNLLLQNLMGRLQIRPPNPPQSTSPFLNLNQSLEDILLETMNNLSDEDDDDDNDDGSRTQLSKEESKLEREIIRTILSGNTDSLKPNSGQAVTIGEHHICVGFHLESGSEYRIWEWHGHIMLFDDENGYNPEYIYGNYFERLSGKQQVLVNKEEAEEKDDVREEKAANSGLRELIESSDSGTARILHRNLNAGSPKFI